MVAVSIDDAGDPRIAPFRALRDRDLRARDRTFIAEGKVVLAALLKARRFTVDAGLMLDRKLPGMADVLAHWPPHAPLYSANQDVVDAIAGFHLHRGVLAIGRESIVETAAALVGRLPADALVVVGVGVANHDNLGAIMRNCAVFGVDAALFDRTSCDPLYRKAIRVSVGAALQIPFAHGGDAADLVSLLQSHGFAIWALTPGGSRDLHQIVPPRRLALLVGTEGEGLPHSLLTRLETVGIAMAGRFDSLNVAAATAIALHHARTR
ncbi:MAG: RNA methyltransferase [Phyllobacteriaceae bacterium]|nr:RNA methyltransferase [Phyllobacteriaceae bacterium]